MSRRITRKIMVGKVPIGGGAPIAIQSMTNTPTTDVEATLAQIHALAAAGCDIVRSSVPDQESLTGFKEIRQRMLVELPDMPLVADIHFDHRLALGAIEAGADKIRFNPGNIGPRERAEDVARAARDAGIPVRVGVNAGSLRKEHRAGIGGLEDLATAIPSDAHGSGYVPDGGYALGEGPVFPLSAHDRGVAEALVHSALWGADLVESAGHRDIVLSVKSSSTAVMVAAYLDLSRRCDMPLHLGLTEAGTTVAGAVKSSVALGALLSRGIGDTLRVSLADDPVVEVKVTYDLLGALGLRKRGVDIIACPTCARCGIDLISLAEEVESDLSKVTEPMRVAVMGCCVNGPGEAREADIGIAAGDGQGLVFVKGEIVAKVPEAELRDALRKHVAAFVVERAN